MTKQEALDYFLHRVTYETAYKHAHGDTPQERERMAYTILAALDDVARFWRFVECPEEVKG